MANYDQFAAAVAGISGGKNVVLLDDLGLPSVYVPINKLKVSELISGGSENMVVWRKIAFSIPNTRM